jgi:colicin import membrane protein
MNMEVLDAPKSIVTEYQPFYAQLAELEANNAKLVFDYESKKGNKEARSHVNTLRLTKGALERTRKSAKEESLRIGRAIDAEAKEINARIEAMILVHQAKLDEIEKRETDRIEALKIRLDEISAWGFGDVAADQIKSNIASLEKLAIDDSWQEFTADAAKLKDARLEKLRADLAAREKYEAEQTELARLRKEAEERAQRERDEAIAKAAAERAAAEAAARIKAEEERARRAIEEAELKAKQEREAAERRELELKLQAEQAERRRIEAEQKAIRDAEEAAQRAEQEKQRAIQAEKDRVAALAKAEAEAQAKREANKAHRAKINNAALAAFVAGGISEEYAKQCIKLIATGSIPNIQINY